MKNKLLRHERCPNCESEGKDISEDNLAVYEDGAYCFACGYTENEESKQVENRMLIDGVCRELKSRKISKETAEFFNYQVGQFDGNFSKKVGHLKDSVQIANYYNDYNEIVGQKLRTRNKDMTWSIRDGQQKLYGSWLWAPNENTFITVVEGEIDALSVVEARGKRWPVVSVIDGAQSAKKCLQDNMEYLSGFKYVVLAFDNDEAGHKAAKECISLFDVGRVRVANWKRKDANEHLVAGELKEISDTIFNAKEIKPAEIISVDDLLPVVGDKPESGINWPWPSLTDITYGFRLGEIYVLAAATSIGKTEFVKEIVFHLLEHKIKIGVFSFEQTPKSTLQRLVGGKINQKLHIPTGKWDKEKIIEGAKSFKDKVYFFNSNKTHITLESIINNIKYMQKVYGISFVVIDNLKALSSRRPAGHGGDNDYINFCVGQFNALVREHNLTILLVTHLAKDKLGMSTYVRTSNGKEINTGTSSYQATHAMSAKAVNKMLSKPGLSWESGRIPHLENIFGTGTLVDLSDFVFVLARNRLSEDETEKKTTVVKCLKARLDGLKSGKSFNLFFKEDEGRLVELADNSQYRF